MDYSVHEKAIVETELVGAGTKIWAFVHILKGARIGKNANICDHCFIEGEVTLGNEVTVKSGVYLWNGITVEDNVFIGPSVTFANDRYPRSKNTGFVQGTIVLKKGCSIGANATILPGVTVGTYAMVGAGAVVTKHVPKFSLVYGSPALPHGFVCMCGLKLVFSNERAQCSCKRKYQLTTDGVHHDE
jgi:acetyltransferase-like isoleucine patch superfamily enzyme